MVRPRDGALDLGAEDLFCGPETVEERRALGSSETDHASDIALVLRRPECGVTLTRLPHRIRDERFEGESHLGRWPDSSPSRHSPNHRPPRITRRSVRP